MDTKTVGIAVGASAIGAALAYLGFTNYEDMSTNQVDEVTKTMDGKDNKKEAGQENEQSDETVKNKNNSEILESEKELNFSDNVKEEFNREIQENLTIGFESEQDLQKDELKIKNEIKATIQKETQREEWGQFWKNEYNSVNKNEVIKPVLNDGV
jgi:hypothetical protein